MNIYIMYVSIPPFHKMRYFLCMGKNCEDAAQQIVLKYGVRMEDISVGQGIRPNQIVARVNAWEIKTDIGVHLDAKNERTN